MPFVAGYTIDLFFFFDALSYFYRFLLCDTCQYLCNNRFIYSLCPHQTYHLLAFSLTSFPKSLPAAYFYSFFSTPIKDSL